MSLEILTEEEKDLAKDGIAWKKVFCLDGNEVLALLSFDPKKANVQRVGGYYVIKGPVLILAIYDMWGYRTSIETANSFYDRSFSYKVGKTVKGENGIWAWPTFNEAVDYWKNQSTMHARDLRYDRLGSSSSIAKA